MKNTNRCSSQCGSRMAQIARSGRLETSDTVVNAAVYGVGRVLLQSALSAVLFGALGLCAISARAQDAPKKEDKPATAPAAAGQPAAAAPAGPAPGTVTVSGLIDGYYQVNYQHPSSAGKPTFAAPFAGVNATRSFDYRDGFGLSLGEINISRTAGKGFPLGVTATLTAFDTPPVVYANDPHGQVGYEGIQQLYLTYSPHFLNHDFTIDFGKFVTPTGYEVIESVNNDNYSRGLVFQYAIPFYHTGLRIATPLSKQLAFTGGLVTGWNSSSDDNDALTIFTQLNWTPCAKFGLIANYMGGAEGTGAYGKSVPTNGGGFITTNLFELIPVYNVTSKFKLAADIVYGNAAGSVSGTHVSGNWLGAALYARYQWTNQFATAIRGEQFEDMPGIGALPGAGAGGLRLGNGYSKLNSFTVTLEYAAFHNKLISRLEYRHDRANHPFGAIGPDQDTLTLGEAYKF